MQIVKAGLKDAKPADLVGKSEHIEADMTGNVNFPTPSPKVTDLTAARTALVAAIAAAEGGAHAAIATKNAAAKTLAQLLTKMARYVNSVAASDVQKAGSSGFALAKRPDPIDHLDAPPKFEGPTAAIAGQVDRRWKGVFGARLTGGGFGGSIVALTRRGAGAGIATRVAAAYASQSHQVPTILVPAPPR